MIKTQLALLRKEIDQLEGIALRNQAMHLIGALGKRGRESDDGPAEKRRRTDYDWMRKSYEAAMLVVNFLKDSQPMTLEFAKKALAVLPLAEVVKLCQTARGNREAVCNKSAFWRAVLLVQHGIDTQNLDASTFKLWTPKEKEYIRGVLALPLSRPARELGLPGMFDEKPIGNYFSEQADKRTKERGLNRLLKSLLKNLRRFGRLSNIEVDDKNGHYVSIRGIDTPRALKLTDEEAKAALNRMPGIELQGKGERNGSHFYVESNTLELESEELLENMTGIREFKIRTRAPTSGEIEFNVDSEGLVRLWPSSDGKHVWLLVENHLFKFSKTFLDDGGVVSLDFLANYDDIKDNLTDSNDVTDLAEIPLGGIKMNTQLPLFGKNRDLVGFRDFVPLISSVRVFATFQRNAYDLDQIDVRQEQSIFGSSRIIELANGYGDVVKDADIPFVSTDMTKKNLGPAIKVVAIGSSQLLPVYATFEATLAAFEKLPSSFQKMMLGIADLNDLPMAEGMRRFVETVMASTDEELRQLSGTTLRL